MTPPPPALSVEVAQHEPEAPDGAPSYRTPRGGEHAERIVVYLRHEQVEALNRVAAAANCNRSAIVVDALVACGVVGR